MKQILVQELAEGRRIYGGFGLKFPAEQLKLAVLWPERAISQWKLCGRAASECDQAAVS